MIAFNDASSAIEQAAAIPGIGGSSFDPDALRQGLTATSAAFTQARRFASMPTSAPAQLSAAKSAAMQAVVATSPHVKNLGKALLSAEAVAVPQQQMAEALSRKADYTAQLKAMKPKKRMAAVEGLLSSATADKDKLALGVLTSTMADAYPGLKVSYPKVMKRYVAGVVNQEQQALAKVGSQPGAIPYSSTLRNRKAVTDVVLSGVSGTFKKIAQSELATIKPPSESR